MIPNGGIVPPLGPPPKRCAGCAGAEVRLVHIGGAIGAARASSTIEIADPDAERILAEMRTIVDRLSRTPEPLPAVRQGASVLLPRQLPLWQARAGGPHVV